MKIKVKHEGKIGRFFSFFSENLREKNGKKNDGKKPKNRFFSQPSKHYTEPNLIHFMWGMLVNTHLVILYAYSIFLWPRKPPLLNLYHCDEASPKQGYLYHAIFPRRLGFSKIPSGCEV